MIKKKQKCAMSSHSLDMPIGDFYHIEPLNQTKERITEFPRASQPYQLRNLFHLQDMEKTKSSQLFATDEVLAKTRGTCTSRLGNLDDNGTVDCGDVNENFSAEVIDHNSIFLDSTDEGFS